MPASAGTNVPSKASNCSDASSNWAGPAAVPLPYETLSSSGAGMISKRARASAAGGNDADDAAVDADAAERSGCAWGAG